MEELSISEKLELKNKEFAEKYADIIKNLGEKYKTPNGVDYLKAIARAYVLDKEPLYTTDVEYDKAELIKDYAAILELSRETLK